MSGLRKTYNRKDVRMQYRLLEGNSPEALSKKVDEHLDIGCELYGSPSVIYYGESKNECAVFIQAVFIK